jgi:hypothetical protein
MTAGVHGRARQRGGFGRLQRTRSRGDRYVALSIETLSLKAGPKPITATRVIFDGNRLRPLAARPQEN